MVLFLQQHLTELEACLHMLYRTIGAKDTSITNETFPSVYLLMPQKKMKLNQDFHLVRVFLIVDDETVSLNKFIIIIIIQFCIVLFIKIFLILKQFLNSPLSSGELGGELG